MIKYQVNHCSQMGMQLLLLLMLIFVAWVSLTPVYEPKPMLINDKLAHFLAYAMLAVTSDHAYATTRYSLKKVAMLFTFGVFIEIAQHFIPGREFSLLDMLANFSGLMLYGLLTITLLKREPTPIPERT